MNVEDLAQEKDVLRTLKKLNNKTKKNTKNLNVNLR